MPKISLIIPVYNTEAFLQRCLRSVVTQTLRDIEIIVVNDGSTDSSPAIIERFVREDDRILLIEQENRGLSASRNRALQAATGEFVSFLDSDDDIKEDMLEQMYETARKEKSEIVLARVERVHEGRGSTLIYPYREREDHLYNILHPNASAIACGKLFKRSLFLLGGITFPEGMYYEDQPTVMRLFYRAQRVSYLEEAYYRYYVREGSITGSLNAKKIGHIFSMIEAIRSFLAEKGLLRNYEGLLHARGIKLLNNNVLRFFERGEELAHMGAFRKNLRQYQWLRPSVIQSLEKDHFGVYFILLRSLVGTERYCDIDGLLAHFDSGSVETVRRHLAAFGSLEFHRLLTGYLQRRGIKKVILYGGGRLARETIPFVREAGVEIAGIVDRNETLCIEGIPMLKKTELDAFAQTPVVVTSIAFSKEIVAALRKRYEGMEIIDLTTLLRMKD